MTRFRAKRSSRCCELCRNVGLRDIGGSRHRGLERNAVRGVASCREMRGCAAAVLVATGLGVSTPFLLRVPKHFRVMVARAARGLAFRGMSRSCSRRAEPGFPGRRQQFLAPHRAWLFGACAAVAIAARRSAAGGECGERVRKRCANPTIRAALAMQKWQTRADAGQTRIRPL